MGICLLGLLVFAECIVQGDDITSDVIGQFHYLVLRVQDLHGLCVGVVADWEGPGDFGSKFSGNKQDNTVLI